MHIYVLFLPRVKLIMYIQRILINYSKLGSILIAHRFLVFAVMAAARLGIMVVMMACHGWRSGRKFSGEMDTISSLV